MLIQVMCNDYTVEPSTLIIIPATLGTDKCGWTSGYVFNEEVRSLNQSVPELLAAIVRWPQFRNPE